MPKPTQSVLPFPNDLDYLQEELRWIEARCRRIGSEALAALQRTLNTLGMNP